MRKPRVPSPGPPAAAASPSAVMSPGSMTCAAPCPWGQAPWNTAPWNPFPTIRPWSSHPGHGPQPHPTCLDLGSDSLRERLRRSSSARGDLSGTRALRHVLLSLSNSGAQFPVPGSRAGRDRSWTSTASPGHTPCRSQRGQDPPCGRHGGGCLRCGRPAMRTVRSLLP
jgi:hypothetical protein